jgi:hypothetical protein
MKALLSLQRLAAVSALLTASASAQVNWEAYNDHRGGAFTAANTSIIEMRGAGVTGPLRNFATGADLTATMSVEEEGLSDDFGANGAPNPGSPADTFFTGKCTIGGAGADGIPGVRSSTTTMIRLRFSNLDPTKRYKLRATTCRGGATVAYQDRWTRFKIVEADGYTAAHTLATIDGNPSPNLITATSFPDAELGPDEVALNSGLNFEGSMIGWDDINPGADGTFAVEERQFVGTAPFGSAVAGPYGYGLDVLYLAEVSSGGGGVGTFTNISSTGNNLKIEWTGPGKLQSSDDLTVWADILGATSPYNFTKTPSRKYFRLHE